MSSIDQIEQVEMVRTHYRGKINQRQPNEINLVTISGEFIAADQFHRVTPVIAETRINRIPIS